MLKFRTMKTDAEAAGVKWAQKNDPRVTRIGKWLRRFRIDELPQILNVVKGEMRLVGPRPEVPEFVDYTLASWRNVLSVPPGITDLATLVYRNEEQLLATAKAPESLYRNQVLPAKLNLNLKYLRHRRLSKDLKLILATLWYCTFPHRLDPDRVINQFS